MGYSVDRMDIAREMEQEGNGPIDQQATKIEICMTSTNHKAMLFAFNNLMVASEACQ